MLGNKFSTIVGNFTRYHSDLNPSISTEFSSAAYRFGHGVLGDDFPTRHPNMTIKSNIKLTNLFFNPTIVSS